jgi:hypothetical protein
MSFWPFFDREDAEGGAARRHTSPSMKGHVAATPSHKPWYVWVIVAVVGTVVVLGGLVVAGLAAMAWSWPVALVLLVVPFAIAMRVAFSHKAASSRSRLVLNLVIPAVAALTGLVCILATTTQTGFLSFETTNCGSVLSPHNQDSADCHRDVSMRRGLGIVMLTVGGVTASAVVVANWRTKRRAE